MLAEYLFGLSKVITGGVVIGALSPLFMGNAMGVANYACIAIGGIATVGLAWLANMLLKVELKKK